jgi:hypothetical protein
MARCPNDRRATACTSGSARAAIPADRSPARAGLRCGPASTKPRRRPAVADRCPVKAECLEWALEHDARHGMWGGKTPRERTCEIKRRAV